MDIELLKTFLEVKTTRHFGKAGENLYLTQAAVSARVRQLEDYLGVKLFHRTRNNIQLTAEGERLVPHAETVLLAWSRARTDVALKTECKQQVTIGAPPDLWHYSLADRLPFIQQHNSALSLRAEAHNTNELLRHVMERTLDIALLYEAPNLPELVSSSVGKLELALLSSLPRATVSTALGGYYIFVDWGTAFALFHAKRFADAPQAAMHTNSAALAEHYLLLQEASAYLPENAARHAKLHKVAGAPSFARNVFAVYRPTSDRLELIKDLLPLLEL